MSRQKKRSTTKRANSPAGSTAKRDPLEKSPGSDGTSSFPSSWWNRDWVLGCLLSVATILAYQRIWQAGFIWDDDAHVTPPGLQSLSGLGRIWMQIGATQQYYPFVYSVFWTEHKLWGDSPLGYHLVNVALHIFSALLLVKLLRQLNIPGAWLAAGLFALHPVEVESVAWVSELKNTLSGAFYLGAALAYLGFDRTRKVGNYALALGLFLLGLMSKTVISSLPAALLVIFWWKRRNLSWARDVLPLIPFFITGISMGLLTAWVERELLHAQGAEYNYTLIERFLIAGRAVWFYLGKLAWPADLAFFYSTWNVNQAVWWQYAYPAGVLLLLGALAWRRKRGALASALFFIGTLFPALGFFNVFPFRYSLVADHFQYLASLGPLVLAAAGIHALSGFFPKSRVLLPGTSTLLLMVLGILTWKQCGTYKNEDTLWQETYRLNSESWMAHNYFGLQYLRQGQLDQAGAEFNKLLEVKPNFADGHDNLGIVLLQQVKTEEALAQFRQALKLKPGDEEICTSLSAALLKEGKVDEAIFYCRMALKTKPDLADAHFNLGLALFDKGLANEAITQYQETLRIEPNHAAARDKLGMALWQQGRVDEAQVHFQKNLEINPADAEAHFYLGNILRQKGRNDDAMAHFQKALEINPAYADAHLNLGNLLLHEWKVDEAIGHFQKAAQLKPGDANAQNNLGNAYLQKGSGAEAIKHYELSLQLDPSNPSAQNNLAWILATWPDAPLRNGVKAVQLAQAADALTGGGNAVILHTLAAALAETGQYSKALETAQRALALAQSQSNNALARQLELELKLYQDSHPFHSAASR
jgi:tetratricopeptide (TPR) repeat protein